MVTNINLVAASALFVPALVQAIDPTLKPWQSREEVGCVPTCVSKNSEVSVYNCLTSSNVSCPCDFNADAIIHTMRCTFDCLQSLTTATRLDPVTEDAVCGPRPSPPNGTRALKFSLPACASACLTPSNFKFNDASVDCADPSNPACVCPMVFGGISVRSTPGLYSAVGNDTVKWTDFGYQKCMLDTCSEQDAAIAIIQMGVDCGQISATASTSQFPFPQNKLKAAFDTVNSGVTPYHHSFCVILVASLAVAAVSLM